jgi:deoxyribose-phosphate aldolase
VGAVIGFPQGGMMTAMKVAETHCYCAQGAGEVDMVANVGKTTSGEWGYVEGDIRAVKQACDSHGAPLKVIFETDYVRDHALLARLCHICSAVGVAYVKTCTGFAYTLRDDGQYRADGARDADVELMRRESAAQVKVKAAGGIRTLERLLRLRELGAARIGTSATRAILDQVHASGA